MSKTAEMDAALDGITDKLFGRSRTECLNTGVCVTCGGEVAGFKDAFSRGEYDISGMCQLCQDAVFGGDCED